MAAHPLPYLDAISTLFSSLVGKHVKVVRASPLLPAKLKGVASFLDADGKLAYVAVSDVGFLASTGAALALIPPAMATEAIRTNSPAASLVDNAYEVLNISASLFNEIPETTLHVKLAKLVVAPPVPPDLLPKVNKPHARLDLDVFVPGYPDGKLSFLSVD